MCSAVRNRQPPSFLTLTYILTWLPSRGSSEKGTVSLIFIYSMNTAKRRARVVLQKLKFYLGKNVGIDRNDWKTSWQLRTGLSGPT